jgi:hypothetical protein
MSKFLIAVAVSAIAAFSLAPQAAQARRCSGVTATARGITQGIATTKAQWRLHRYVRNNLSGSGVRAGPRNACQGWGANGGRPMCKSAALVCS